jgi:hypothetical protein
VTHFGQNEVGEQVQATESAAFQIRAMGITVIDIVPGCIGMIHVEGQEAPPTVDLTGYWDAILTPPGGEPNPPHLLYLKQTDSSLNISDGLTGTVDVEGMAVTIVIPDFEATLVGTIGPDDTITGTLEMMGQIFGAELRRSVLDFGTFTLSGLIDVNTDRGLGSMSEDQLSYRLDFDVRTSALQGHITFWSEALLPPGDYEVVGGWSSDFESGEVGASWFFPDYEGEISAESGTLTLTRNDSSGASGHFDVQFEGGNSLSGSLELNQPTWGGGLVSVDGGYWDGAEVTSETASGIFWNSGPQVDWGDCNIDYLDEDRKVWLDLGPMSGTFAAGTYLVPDQLSVSAGQRYDEGSEFEAEAESGTLVITRFEEGVGVAGYFENMVFAEGTLSGSFDVSFELTDYE